MDFPKDIHEIKLIGIIALETWVKDSHTEYFGVNDFRISSRSIYDDLKILNITDKSGFEHSLKIHQRGETDYPTFCKHCAKTGVERWFADLNRMTCTYYDTSGSEILVERIPG